MILADEIEKLCEPQGLGIIIKAQHYCMKWRGVKEPQTSMVNSVVRGDFRHDPSLKQEFLSWCVSRKLCSAPDLLLISPIQ